jgi:hypothetical protein
VAEAGDAAAGGPGLKSPAALLALLLLATYAYFLPAPAWNESSRFALVRSLVERQRVDIDPFHIATQDKAFRAGHYYSDKAPGAAFLAVPAYAAYYAWLRLSDKPPPQAVPESVLKGGKGGDASQERVFLNDSYRRAVYLCNLATNGLAGAALGALFFLVLAASGMRAGVALAGACALSAGTSWFAYSTLFFGHVLAGAFLFAAFVVIGPFFEARPDQPWRPRRLLGAGALLGLAVLCELPAVLGVATLGVYALTRARRGQRIQAGGWLALGMAPPILLLAAYQLAAFGNPFSSGYGHLHDPTFAEGMSRGLLGVSWPRPAALWGMLMGRTRGLLYLSPVLALGFYGLGRALWAGWSRPEAALSATVVASFLLMSAGYYMWWGGAALGPRHVVPALPFLALGLPWAIRARQADRVGRGGVLVLGILLVISVINQVGAVTVSPLVPFGPDVLVDHVYGHLRQGEVAILPGSANGGMLLGLRGSASLLPLLLLWLLGLGAIRSFWGAPAADRHGREPADAPDARG